MPQPEIHNAMELETLVQQMGFLPFFACSIPRFSIEEFTPSRDWYPDLVNYRRDGYDFDARYEDGLASYREKRVMDVLFQNGPTLSRDLNLLCPEAFDDDLEKLIR